MYQILMRVKILERIKFFQRDERRLFVPATYDFISFLFELFVIAFLFKTIEYYSDGVHKSLTFIDSIYFIMTTATTVGYGDISPSTVFSKIFIIIFVFLYLSYRLVSMLSRAIDAHSHKKRLKEIGRLFMTKKNHVIIYCDALTIKRDNFLWLQRFAKEHFTSNKFKSCPILLVNHNEDANQILNDAMVSNDYFNYNISHVNSNIDEDGFFDKICIEDAEHIYILGNSNDTHSDSKVFDMAYRIEAETKYNKHVTAEVVNDSGRNRMKNAVGVDVIMRPSRSYPELLVSATIAPGTEQLFEELTSRGGDSFEVFNIEGHQDFLFGDALYALSMRNIGTIVAVTFNDKNIGVDANISGQTVISDAKNFIVMIHEMKDKCYNDIEKEIKDIINSLKIEQ